MSRVPLWQPYLSDSLPSNKSLVITIVPISEQTPVNICMFNTLVTKVFPTRLCLGLGVGIGGMVGPTNAFRKPFPVEFPDKNCTIDRVRQAMIQNGGHFTDFPSACLRNIYHENWKKKTLSRSQISTKFGSK